MPDGLDMTIHFVQPSVGRHTTKVNSLFPSGGQWHEVHLREGHPSPGPGHEKHPADAPVRDSQDLGFWALHVPGGGLKGLQIRHERYASESIICREESL